MTHLVSKPNELRAVLNSVRQQQVSIGFVPTMGNLHPGHIALVKEAQAHCDYVVVSIFVNPMQFNNSVDLENYPRTLEQDLAALSAAGANLAFVPEASALYPNGLEQETRVQVPGLSTMLEGALRPGHFDGVSTIVCKLFNLVQPNVAVFGEKDFQQLALIRKMTEDLLLPISIIGLPTVRESNGLAMSSRNNRLSAEQRHLAPQLAQHMQLMATELRHDNRQALQTRTKAQLEQQGFVCDGIDIVDADTLKPLTQQSRRAVILVAAFLGEVRLIDNCVIELNPIVDQ
ncbi:pantoate--beta-alanine ligase [Agarivorans sp. TSD2052]|uniref:pantoate--beta-alanine ligase n=1 Tax=Agarivorans sp. TSD2052 TaxID=2937286 RepID=UPI00200F209A|nr:pantoate--beta-alanine ligase [Agarivorans sp. TSD2052]UPW19234.1 pantoate--beta-alanine ligase [Agarivorans sp. TSD2052]